MSYVFTPKHKRRHKEDDFLHQKSIFFIVSQATLLIRILISLKVSNYEQVTLPQSNQRGRNKLCFYTKT